MEDIVDINKAISAAPDSVSRFITRAVLSFMHVKELNNFYHNLAVPVSDPKFATKFLDELNVSRISRGTDVHLIGQFIAVVPIVSGFMETLTTISEVIETSGRDDIKIVPVDPWIIKLPLFNQHIFESDASNLLNDSLKFLKNGGSLVYFVRMNAFYMTIELEHLMIPCRLSRLTQVPIVNYIIDFDANIKTSWTTLFGDWIFNVFSIRRFFSNSGTSVLTVCSKPYLCSDGEKLDKEFVRKEFTSFFYSSVGRRKSSVFNINNDIKKKIKFIVSRGTKK